MIEEMKEIAVAYYPVAIVFVIALIILAIGSIPMISKWLIKTDIYLSTKNKGDK